MHTTLPPLGGLPPSRLRLALGCVHSGRFAAGPADGAGGAGAS